MGDSVRYTKILPSKGSRRDFSKSTIAFLNSEWIIALVKNYKDFTSIVPDLYRSRPKTSPIGFQYIITTSESHITRVKVPCDVITTSVHVIPRITIFQFILVIVSAVDFFDCLCVAHVSPPRERNVQMNRNRGWDVAIPNNFSSASRW